MPTKPNIDITEVGGMRGAAIKAMEELSGLGHATDSDRSFIFSMATLYVGDQLARIAEALEADNGNR